MHESEPPPVIELIIYGGGQRRHIKATQGRPATRGSSICNKFQPGSVGRDADRQEDELLPICSSCLKGLGLLNA